MAELIILALDVLQKYQRTEEQHYVTSYVQIALRDYETWQFDHEQAFTLQIKTKGGAYLCITNMDQTIIWCGRSTEMSSAVTSTYDEWDNM
uniref:Uncharacterized protein n=1 Tax=Onchocerca volvulus TaxID=6282 RepID=A0A8R1U118_ONCVO